MRATPQSRETMRMVAQKSYRRQSIAANYSKVSLGLAASGFGSRPADFAFGDLAQGDHDIPVVRFDEWFSALEKLPGSFRGELDKDKATGNFF
jgi:hypothetical protein